MKYPGHTTSCWHRKEDQASLCKTNRVEITVQSACTWIENNQSLRVLLEYANHFYRPQRKFREGNVFTPVCDSVHRRGLCPGISVQGVYVRGVLCPGGLCSGGLCSGGCSLSKGPLSKESLSREVLCPGWVSIQRGSLSGKPHGKNGRYTSYWNTLLL